MQHATGQNYEPREGVREDVGHRDIHILKGHSDEKIKFVG